MKRALSKSLATAIFSGLMVAATAVPGLSQGLAYRDMSCSQLWHARNAIYARKGYCFRTRRARQVFGPRCFPPYGRLTRSEQRQVNAIQSWERRYGC